MSHVPVIQLAFQQLEMSQANVRTPTVAEGSWEGWSGFILQTHRVMPDDEVESMQGLQSDACKSECGLQH